MSEKRYYYLNDEILVEIILTMPSFQKFLNNLGNKDKAKSLEDYLNHLQSFIKEKLKPLSKKEVIDIFRSYFIIIREDMDFSMPDQKAINEIIGIKCN